MTALASRRHLGGLRDTFRAEWTKFRTVRGWLIGLLLAALALVLFSYLQAHGKHTGYCTSPNPNSCVAGHPYVPNGPGGEAVADAYELVATRLAGNGTITTRITALTGRIWAGPSDEAPSLRDTRPGLAGWSKAGLLITPSTRQGAAYAAVMATGGHGIRFQYDYTHDQPGLSGAVSPADARWLRLTRSGDTITGYDSTDGTTWHQIGRTQLAGLPRTVSVGLFATSPQTYGGQASQATGAFDHVAVSRAAAASAALGTADPWRATSTGVGPGDFYTALGRGGERRARGSILVTGSGDIAPAVANTGPDTAADSLLFGTVVALIVLIVVGTMFATSEYRRGLIRTTLAATPRRGRVLVAKAAVIGAAGFGVGALASAAAIPLAEHVMRANGNYVLPAGRLTIAGVIAGSGALIGISAVAVMALATILRRSPATILLAVVVFVLPAFTGPGVLGPSSGGTAVRWLYTVTPAAGFSVLGLIPRSGLVNYPYTMSNGYYPLPAWAGVLVLSAYAAAALYAAQFVLRRRDA
jgi:hypothetical protein